MCFSEQWSLNLSILGLLLTSFRIYNKYPIYSVIIALFYTIMELTQYFQYKVIDQCDNKINQNLTKFTWFLEWIQPLMWNIIYYYRHDVNKDVFKFTITLSFIIFIGGLLRVFNYSKNKSKTHELQVKGRNCSIKGKKHIAWNNNAQTFYGLEPNWFSVIIIWFLPMFWIKPFNVGIFTFIFNLSAIILTYIIIGNKINDEGSSTWCLISIPGLILSEFL